MFAITTLFLTGFIQEQLGLYFKDSDKDELEKKIREMKITIEQLIPEIVEVDPSHVDEIDGWQENPPVLKNSLYKLEEKQKSEKTDEIGDIILRLQKFVRDQEEFFLGKTIAIGDWNVNKCYLQCVMSLLKNESVNRMLTSEEIINILNLLPLNQCTSELGYYKEFARGIDKNGKSFTKIFYLLKSDEKSYFHKLNTTETWTWLGKSPLSLFTLENGELIEHTLSEGNPSVVVPSQTWFGAAVKRGEKADVENGVPFALVTCHCTPAFVLSSYHDDIMEDEEVYQSLINIYEKADSEMQSSIIMELLVPQYREKFRQKISVK